MSTIDELTRAAEAADRRARDLATAVATVRAAWERAREEATTAWRAVSAAKRTAIEDAKEGRQ